MIHVVDVILSAVAVPYCANVLLPVVPVPPKYIVSVVMAIVIALVDIFTNVTAVPVGNATEPFAGIVIVVAA